MTQAQKSGRNYHYGSEFHSGRNLRPYQNRKLTRRSLTTYIAKKYTKGITVKVLNTTNLFSSAILKQELKLFSSKSTN